MRSTTPIIIITTAKAHSASRARKAWRRAPRATTAVIGSAGPGGLDRFHGGLDGSGSVPLAGLLEALHRHLLPIVQPPPHSVGERDGERDENRGKVLVDDA